MSTWRFLAVGVTAVASVLLLAAAFNASSKFGKPDPVERVLQTDPSVAAPFDVWTRRQGSNVEQAPLTVIGRNDAVTVGTPTTPAARSANVIDTLTGSASLYQLSGGADPIYDNFVCPEFMALSVDTVRLQKRCLIAVEPTLSVSIPWGPVVSYLWSGDIGYWTEEVKTCPSLLKREYVRGTRMYCTLQIDFLELPPIRRLIPKWNYETEDGVITMGYAVAYQPSTPNSCPVEFSSQKGMCEEFQSGKGVEDFAVVLQRAAALPVAAGNGSHRHVMMTVATFDYAESAMIWHHSLAAQGRTGMVVVALDLGSYIYLSNRGVAVVLVRSIIAALELGYSVTMMDLDVILRKQAADLKFLSTYDLVEPGGYSFMFTYSAPSSLVIAMWKDVLTQVLGGGWDQSQFNYYGKLLSKNPSARTTAVPFHSLLRSQNNFDLITEKRLQTHGGHGNSTSSGFLSALTQNEAAAVFYNLSALNASVADQESRRVVSGMLNVLPGPHSRFLAWADDSLCSTPPNSTRRLASEAADAMDWHWRKQCIDAVILMGVWGQRYIIIPDAFKALYNFNQMGNWFPFILHSKFAAITGSVAPTVESFEPVSASPRQKANSTGGSDLGMLLASSQKLIVVHGSPSETLEHAKQHFPLPSFMRKFLFLFVTPAPPHRLTLQCMRDPGPASPSNPNPTCLKRPLRTDWDMFVEI